ncbi:hypothetical protein [Candidatus Phytoplasma solani]|nr:hypothetical protein [Candidatus Phytoplasma solani]
MIKIKKKIIIYHKIKNTTNKTTRKQLKTLKSQTIAYISSKKLATNQ